MKGVVVTVKKLVKRGGVNYARVELYENDEQEYPIYNPSNIESLPIVGQKALLFQLDKSGEKAVFGVPIETSIKSGETKIKATTESGVLKTQIYLQDDGQIFLGLNGLRALVTESALAVINAHIHPLDLTKQITGPPTIPLNDSVLTSKVKVP